MPGPRRPRVLVVTPDFPPTQGGISRYVHEVVRRWDRVEPRVVAMDPRGVGVGVGFDPDPRVAVTRTGGGRRSHRLGVAWLNAIALGEAARRRPSAIYAAHLVTTPGARTASVLLRIPMLLQVHAAELEPKARLSRFALRKADRVLAVSRYSREVAVRHGAEAARTIIASPGVSPVTKRSSRPPDPPTIVTVSRMDDRRKGHDVMIEALSLVRDRVPGVRWVVIGDGVLRPSLEQRVTERGLDGSVVFTGYLPDGGREEWLARAHVFAMPSRISDRGGGEGFGIVFLEAAAHGLPVVAGDAGGTLDAVVDGETGLLVDPASPEAVGEALTRLLADPQLAHRLGDAGAGRAATFDWTRTARAVEDAILESIGNAPAARASGSERPA